MGLFFCAYQRIAALVWLPLSARCCVLACDAAKGHNVSQCIAAKAVVAMYAAGNFASRIESRNDISGSGNYPCFSIDL
jgi:hypothetical protein